MTQETIEKRKNQKKIAPILITVIVVVYMASLILLAAAVLLGWGASSPLEAFITFPFLLIYALIGGAVIAGVLYALHQRLREIDGGEEEAAAKY